MTTAYTDFSEYSAGSPPGDWTDVGSSASLNIADIGGGEHVLQVTPTGAARVWNSIIWDTPGTDNIVETVARFRLDSGLTFYGIGHGVAARAQGTGTATHYSMGLTDNFPQYYVLSVGASTALDQANTTDTTYNQWRWMRLRCEGTTIEGWEWLDGDPEKTNSDPPDFSGTDSTYSSGYGGVIFDSSSATATMEISDFGIGLAGDAAPTSAVGGLNLAVIINHMRTQGIL